MISRISCFYHYMFNIRMLLIWLLLLILLLLKYKVFNMSCTCLCLAWHCSTLEKISYSLTVLYLPCSPGCLSHYTAKTLHPDICCTWPNYDMTLWWIRLWPTNTFLASIPNMGLSIPFGQHYTLRFNSKNGRNKTDTIH